MKKNKIEIQANKSKDDSIDKYFTSLSEADLNNLGEKISKRSKEIKNTKKGGENSKKEKKSNLIQIVTGIAMLLGIILGIVYVIYLK